MNLEKVVAVSGLPGLYKLVTPRNNGLIVEDFDTGKKRFISIRQHVFTPLASVSIFTEDEPEELNTIFAAMEAKAGELDADTALENNQDLAEYFGEILPSYDRDRVHIGDMKKVVKWYLFLRDHQLLHGGDEEE